MSKQVESHSPTVSKPASSQATISLIAGILGLTLFPFLGSLVAVFTGIAARREIRDSDGALGGDGMATVGLVLGWVGVALSVIGLCLAGLIIGLSLCIILFAVSSEIWTWLVPLALAVV